ncbi:hypothetical protein [Cryptosporidium hominis TU502]|uniref:hypothetical protein n=1 Tax=Cryptosporidium hominis (strain TU502) TaxID=353151 RepID=UPI000045355B|nr:hypothetical protein [Cryptosporidium hominis TU502]
MNNFFFKILYICKLSFSLFFKKKKKTSIPPLPHSFEIFTYKASGPYACNFPPKFRRGIWRISDKDMKIALFDNSWSW